jgi:hypothetical protein
MLCAMNAMQRRQFSMVLCSAAALALLPRRADALSESEAATGIRAALERGAVVAVNLLGRPDGFLGNPKVRIPLPGALNDAAGLLRAIGQQRRVDELVTAMNRAAEAAVPEAKSLLVQAVKAMSVEDARRILAGGDDAATQFLPARPASRWARVSCRSSRGRLNASRWPRSTTRWPAARPAWAWCDRKTRMSSSTSRAALSMAST